MNDLWWAVIGAVLGVAFQYLIILIVKLISITKGSSENNHISIKGQWYAAWQTSVERTELINTEKLKITQFGKKINIKNLEKSKENPKGGYLWHAEMNFYNGKYLMGLYFPLRKEQSTSKGIMYLTYISPRKIFYGKWVGCGYDGDFQEGFAIFAKNRTTAIKELTKIIKNNNDSVRIITYDFD